MVEKLYRLKWTRMDGLGALVLTPTRELAMQIFEELVKVCSGLVTRQTFIVWVSGMNVCDARIIRLWARAIHPVQNVVVNTHLDHNLLTCRLA